MLEFKEIDVLFCLQQNGEREVVIRPGDEESDGNAYLAFDNKLCRFVTVDIFPNSLPPEKIPAIEQRIALGGDIVHPNLPFVIDYGRTAENELFVTSEFVEGEPLFNYLRRDKDLPGEVVAGIILQICDALNSLKHTPRLLASIDLSDFWVCLDRGRLLSARLGHYGLGRDETPISDFALLKKWVKAVVELHRQYAKPEDITNPDAYDSILHEVENQKLFLDDLPRLKLAVLRSMSLSTDIAVRFPADMRTIHSIKQVPAGLMFQMMTRENQLSEMLNDRFVANPEHDATEFSPFSLHVARPADGDNPREAVSIYLVPPERLFVDNIIEPVHRKMFDPHLRAHNAGFRIRSLSCETHFTYLTTTCYQGFPLPCLQASRSLLRGGDALQLMRKLHETILQFEHADFDLGKLNPWQVQICFENADEVSDARELMTHIPFAEWPAWTIRIRVEKPAETFVESCLSTWRYIARRMKGKDFPALLVWMLEQERFEWALSNGVQIADQEPLSWNPRLDALFLSALNHLDPHDAEQRERFLEFFDEARDRSAFLTDGDTIFPKQESLLTSPNLQTEG